MNAIQKSVSQNVQEWVMELLGMRNYIRAANDRIEGKKIARIIELVEKGEVEFNEARAVFIAARDKNMSLDEIIIELERPSSIKKARGILKNGKYNSPVEKAMVSQMRSVSSQTETKNNSMTKENEFASRILELEKKISTLSGQIKVMEDTAKALVERAVLDATRIHGMEAVIMGIAQGSGISKDVEEIYSHTTGEFLRKREHLLKRY